MSNTELLELAERCEKATGPNHELNLAIFRAIKPEYADEDTWQPYGLGVRHKYDSSDARCLPPPEATAANYTASIDAAMALVPEGCTWELSTDFSPPHAGIYTELGDEPQCQADAATPALALCAAALKARASQ